MQAVSSVSVVGKQKHNKSLAHRKQHPGFQEVSDWRGLLK